MRRVSIVGMPVSAEVAELADAQASGACGGNPVGVQIPPSAPCTTRGVHPEPERSEGFRAWVHGGAKVSIPKKRNSRGACPESSEAMNPDLGEMLCAETSRLCLTSTLPRPTRRSGEHRSNS